MGQVGRVGKTLAMLLICLFSSVSPLPALPDPRGSLDQPGRRVRAPQPKPKGRLFATQDLGLLEAPDRDQWQKPDQVMDALGIAEGSIVAELGAAGGWFTLRVARRVGPNGLVYAEDIQPLMLEAISRRMQSENLTNVKPVLGTQSDPRLPPGLDAALISDAYHEMDEPGDPMVIVRLLRNIARSLKPQGRLGIVDWTPGAGGPGPPPDQRVDPADVIKDAEAAGLQLISREEFPPFVYLLVFGRAANARPSP
jgi:SAM-dependent methyltransferase